MVEIKEIERKVSILREYDTEKQKQDADSLTWGIYSEIEEMLQKVGIRHIKIETESTNKGIIIHVIKKRSW